ncbi:ABC transporter substrate-binding protein [Natrialba hulunbeirensis JCM 10989]|uniref:ABC transporter substrate-binding protein n=1 Tax=Natrialba hulunbeirensis JCM 10989 TaxID=1227493 RepID=L9ZSX5_9EURY|nr:ABC transporter substrate-binding protein [Natrialba hulunbeirensis]ELY88642.1 ABC transporter substrate-binding protein [Natrialba hulunbeirensis JCM 10989]
MRERQRIGRRDLLSTAAGATIVATAGCLSDGLIGDTNGDSRPALSERTLRYGGVLPQSGGLGAVGGALENATTLPIAELEESELDVTIEYEGVDSETTPTAAVDAVADLIEDGYPAVVGAAGSDVTLQMTQQATIPAEVVSCSPASTSPTVGILNDRGFSFRTAPDDSMQAVVAAQLAVAEHDAETAATLYTAGDYGRQLSGAFSASFDGEIQRQVSFTEGSESFDEPIAEALSGEPDILFLVSYMEDGVGLLTDYYDGHAGDEVVFVSDGLQEDSIPQGVDASFTDIYGTAPVSSGPGQGTFARMYRDEFGADPAIFTANSYDAAATILLANAAAGENDGAAIRSHMIEVTTGDGTEIQPGELADGLELAAAGEPIRYRGASGEIEFDESGDGGSITYEYFTFGEDSINPLSEHEPEGVAQ